MRDDEDDLTRAIGSLASRSPAPATSGLRRSAQRRRVGVELQVRQRCNTRRKIIEEDVGATRGRADDPDGVRTPRIERTQV